MKRGHNLASLILIGSLTVTGCSSLRGPGGTAWHRDSSLANHHPAPESMVPQLVSADGEATLDPVHLKSQADFHFTMGEAFSLEGRTEKAIEAFKLTLIYDPRSVLVRERLAVEYVRLGLMSEAMERAEEAVELDPGALDARLLYAGLLSSLKMYEKALEQYEAAQKGHPDNPDVPIYVGAILAEQQKYADAVEHFRRVLATPKYPQPEKAHFYIGRILSEQGGQAQLKEAEVAYAAALKEKPDYEEAVLAYARLMGEQGKNDQAIRLLASFQDRFGPLKEVSRVLAKAYLEKENYEKALEQLEHLEGFERDNLNVRAQMALILIERKQYEEAAIRLEDILAQSPELDKIRYYLGAVYEELKKGDLAILQYQQIPPSSPYFTEGIVHSAHILRGEARFAEATKVLDRAIALREDIPQFYAYYASILDDQKMYQDAIKLLDRAIEKFPTHAQLHFFMGSMQDRLGNQDLTISHMKKVLDLESDHVQALNYLAYVYAEKGVELDEAESLARRALAKSPADGYILDTLGWVLFKRGSTEQAIQYLEAAYKAKSDESIIAEHLGDAYFSHQLLDKARLMYKKASELDGAGERQKIITGKIAAVDQQRDQTKSRLPASNEGSKP